MAMSASELNRSFASVVQALETVENLARKGTGAPLGDWLARIERELGHYLDVAASIPCAPCEASDDVLWMLVRRIKKAIEDRNFEQALSGAIDFREELAAHHRMRVEAASGEPHLDPRP